jgi:polyribonucleotide nucleotidyltransferase
MYKEEAIIAGSKLSLETGNWAKQADGAIVYRTGKLVLLATVCAASEAKEGQDFFPLTVEYRERTYAVGRFPGGYFKRETRPAEHETLISRIIDRPIRPLFPEGYFAEVQVFVTVLSGDPEISVEGHAVTAASAAIHTSDVPFGGPIAGVVVGRVDGQFVADAGPSVMAKSDVEMTVAGSSTHIVMIEGICKEYPKKDILDAVAFAHENIKQKIALQEKLAKTVNVTKRTVDLRLPDPELKKQVYAFASEMMGNASRTKNKLQRQSEVDKVMKDTKAHFDAKLRAEGKDEKSIERAMKDIKENLALLEYEVVRSDVFDKGVRYDGRKLDEIRDISIELDVLPGVHGSAVFTRGQTQSLGVVTLGTGNDAQKYENLSGLQSKNFMLHYNFPPFSTGEVKRWAGPGRREIGHGNLAERALKVMMPPADKFPYVTRVVSEILESNGSSSMASVCSGSLALMAAGVPIPRTVAGIAMGLILGDKEDDFVILSDIAGLEDHFGDMDFKVAGTDNGITAFQLDIKLTGVTPHILGAALDAAEKGRAHISGKMNAAITNARPSVSDNAPRITQIQIDPERIGELIGPGGKMIRAIIEKSKSEINVEDSGVVTIASAGGEANEYAKRLIMELFTEIELGSEYEGVVKRVADFGAFIEILPGKEGLLHISKMAPTRINSVRDVMNEGDKVEVVVTGVDRQGKIELGKKDLVAAAAGITRPSRHDGPTGPDDGGPRRDRGPGGDRGRGGDRGGRGGDRGGRDRGPRRH